MHTQWVTWSHLFFTLLITLSCYVCTFYDSLIFFLHLFTYIHDLLPSNESQIISLTFSLVFLVLFWCWFIENFALKKKKFCWTLVHERCFSSNIYHHHWVSSKIYLMIHEKRVLKKLITINVISCVHKCVIYIWIYLKFTYIFELVMEFFLFSWMNSLIDILISLIFSFSSEISTLKIFNQVHIQSLFLNLIIKNHRD